MHCIDIGIGEERYGIASGIISFRNNIVMALDSCPNAFLGERDGSVVECRTPEREVGGSKPTAAVLCP